MTETPAATEPTRRPWHALPPEQAMARVGSAPGGLTLQEASARLASHGRNEVPRKGGDGPLRLLLRQVANPIAYLLLAAAALAFLLGKTVDAYVVLGAIAVNVAIGFLQELRAGKAIDALSRLVPDVASVTRGGARVAIPAAELVPGDIVHLASGDNVPADVRILAARQLRVDESALTGESVPAAKATAAVEADAAVGDRTGMAFGGTHVVSGAADALVVETGAATELGRISALLAGVTELQTPLTRALARVGTWLTAGVVALSGALLLVAMARGFSLSEALLVSVTLAVATIPEGLPAIITIALAVGVQRMAARRAVVRHLPSVEALGSTTVICSDKTGTLTRNEMTVQTIWTPLAEYAISGVGYAPEGRLSRGGVVLPAAPADAVELLRAGLLCADAALERAEEGWRVVGDPTEGALVTAAGKAGLAAASERARFTRVDAIPFESERQFMATLHRSEEGERVVHLKGAPEVVLARCALPPGLGPELVLAEVSRLAGRGLRVLALARGRAAGDRLGEGDVDGGLELLGLAGMIDPPRLEAVAAVRACHGAGITVKMITGDHRGTAEAIGAELGLSPPGGRAVTGSELAGMDDASLERVAAASNVFARVAPEHKLRLVKALQARGQVVAMTGDGVNDAPALKQADIGVAMGITGTAVAKAAAGVVLADDNFATIATAVEEGRRIYDNLLKSLAFVVPTNLGLGLIMVAAVLFFPIERVGGELVPLMPVLPTQLLWVNLVASVALSLPLPFEVKERDVMRRGPRSPGEPIFGRFMAIRTALAATLMAAGAVGLFLWEYQHEVARGGGHALALAEAQTMAVTTVVFFQVFYLLNCRSLRESVFKIGFFSNPTVFAGVAALAILHAAFVYLPFMNRIFGTAPLDAESVLAALLVASAILPVITLEKLLRQRVWPPSRRHAGGPLACEQRS